MGEQTRDTLRKYFKAGQLPTEDHFGDLIESMLNMKDEGFRKTPHNGLEVSAPGNEDTLLSVYRDRDPGDPVWTLGYGKEQERQLQFNRGRRDDNGNQPAVLSLNVEQSSAGDGTVAHQMPRVGINTDTPQHTLDVAGVAAAQGRLGTWRGDKLHVARAGIAIPADGVWNTLIDGLSGCQAFEVVAGVGGGAGSGRFSVLHAIVTNAYNPLPGWLNFLRPKRGIRATTAHYGRRCDRLELRWQGDPGKQGQDGREASYRLEVRTRCNYGRNVMIRCAVTQLWFDPTMLHSQAG
jgi:hypothetical protein